MIHSAHAPAASEHAAIRDAVLAHDVSCPVCDREKRHPHDRRAGGVRGHGQIRGPPGSSGVRIARRKV
jgi:hypothetical protein